MSYAPSSNTTNEPLTVHDSEVFQIVTLNSDLFVIPQRGGGSTLSGEINCSLLFSKQFGSINPSSKLIWVNLFISLVASPDGRACLAVGCAEGLWIGYRNDSQCEGCAPTMYACLLFSCLSHSHAPCIGSQDGDPMCDARKVRNFPRPRR